MNWKDFVILLLCFTVAAVFLAGANLHQKPIQDARQEMGLILHEDPLKNAPPSLAFATVAMGAFRGLIVDILWMRADTLKQEGKFFDAKQLAEWITILQPRFAKVWDFHAWNMAYNISVAIPNTQCDERWRWVKNGYELLRDKGIPLNPKEISLYRSLAWIFWHKIGDNLDDCHRYYKRELALSMRPLIGENTSEEFQRLVAAPERMNQILEDPEVLEFITALRQADPLFAEQTELVEQYLTLRQSPARFSEQASRVLEEYKALPGLSKFDAFARAYVIRNTWKMDLELMNRMNQDYGPVVWDDPNERLPLNWEHPAVHGMYWGIKGLNAASRPDEYRVDEKNTDRIVFHSLQQLYRNGNVILYTNSENQTAVFLRPDLRMFRSCDETWRKIIEKYEDLEGGNPKAVRGGHKNFLENAIMSLYQAGHREHARRLYDELRRLYPVDDVGNERTEYRQDLLQFVYSRFQEEMQGMGLDDATEAIVLTLREALFRYALRQDDEAATREDMAKQIYDYFHKEMDNDVPDRLKLPSMDLMRYAAFRDFWMDPQYPEELKLALAGRIQIEKPQLFERLQQQEEWWIQQMEKFQQQQSQPPGMIP